VREQIPSEILRLLAGVDGVRLVCGGRKGAEGVSCHIAPFEGPLYCIVDPKAPALRRLFVNPEARIEAESASDEFNIRIRGRAVPGRSVMSNRRRSELLHWVPDGGDPRVLLAVPFWPEYIEYKKGTEQFEGPTPMGKERPSLTMSLLEAGMGRIWPAIIFSFIAIWLWVAYAGRGQAVWQFYSLPIAFSTSLLLLVGSNLAYRAACFRRVIEGRCLPESAPQLSEGLLSHRLVVRLSVVCLAVGAALCALLSAMESWLLPVTLVSSLLWVLWPMWAIHLLQKEPESPHDQRRPRR